MTVQQEFKDAMPLLKLHGTLRKWRHGNHMMGPMNAVPRPSVALRTDYAAAIGCVGLSRQLRLLENSLDAATNLGGEAMEYEMRAGLA